MTLSFRNAMRGSLAAAGLFALAVGQNANAAVVPTIFDTGAATNNPTTGAEATFTANDAIDAHYTLFSSLTAPTTAPIRTNAASAFVLNPASFPSTAYAPYTDAKYISPSNTAAQGAGNPLTYYDYSTTFDLTGYLPTTATLTGKFNDDNYMYAIFLNGARITTIGGGAIPGNQNPATGGDLNTSISFTLTSGFAAGVNSLDFVVFNDGFTGVNPNALAIGNARLTATAVPEPGSVAMLVGIGMSGAGFLIRRKRRA